MSHTSRYQKLSIALQHYLHGARYYDALRAYDFGKSIHTGMRKDGITPEFQHQIEIALFLTTLRDIQDEEGAIITAILHDVLEDYSHISAHEIQNLVGKERAQSIIVISKDIQGKKQYSDMIDYFDAVGCDIRASMVKGADRVHNLRTMHGAFTPTKQESYVEETKTYFLPMLKNAVGLYPQQYLAYMNIRTMLKTQMELIEYALEGHKV